MPPPRRQHDQAATYAAPPKMEPHRPDQRGPAPIDPMLQYNEQQRDEFDVISGIYGDVFQKLEGRTPAWQTYPNLKYGVHLTATNNLDIFVDLTVEYPKDYPRVTPVVKVVQVEAPIEIAGQVRQATKSILEQNAGQVVMYDICSTVVDLLGDYASQRAAARALPTLEEERLAQQAAELRDDDERMRRLEREEPDDIADIKEVLEGQEHIEETQPLTVRTLRTAPEAAEERSGVFSPGLVTFPQAMYARDTMTNDNFMFNKVQGNTVLVRRKDKKVTIVTPIAAESITVPELVLKEIRLSESHSESARFTGTMQEVEALLEGTKEFRHTNVVDVLGYRVQRTAASKDENPGLAAFWELTILTEYSKKGSLADHLLITGSLRPDMFRAWARQLLDALEFFDKHAYVHPAVHAGNILIFLSPRGEVTVKLSDGYGTALRSLVVQARAPHIRSLAERPPLWQPPELAGNSHARTAKTCIWDLGVVMLQMASGMTMTEYYTSPTDAMIGIDYTTLFQEMLTKIFQDNPHRRARAFDLQNIEFFRDKEALLFNNKSPSIPTTPSRRRREISAVFSSSADRYEQEWEQMARLGKGAFGEVYKARYRLDGQVYAVKKVECKSRADLDVIVAETKLLSRINHPYVVRYYNAWDEKQYIHLADSNDSSDAASDVAVRSSEDDMYALPSTGIDFLTSANQAGGIQFGYSTSDADEGIDNPAHQGHGARLPTDSNPFGSDEDNNLPEGTDIEPSVDHRQGSFSEWDRRPEKSTLYIQMELCENQSLRNHLKDLHNNVDEIWRMFRQMLEGLAHIHKHGVVHRDLKPDNIFIDASSNIRIGDFGLATTGMVAAAVRTQTQSDSRYSIDVGTPLYMAPEVRAGGGGRYTSKVDMFSIGVVFFEMCFAMKTESERGSTLKMMGEPDHKLPPHFDEARWSSQGDIISKLLNHRQDSRPSAAELLASDLIPQPLEDERFKKAMETMSEKDPKYLVKLLRKNFDTPVQRSQDLLWESRSFDMTESPQTTLCLYVHKVIEGVFRRHGAVSSNRQTIFPAFGYYSNAAKFVDRSGVVVQLPYDLTLPFARMIAKAAPEFPKSYAIGVAYREVLTATHPRRVSEICFDFVSRKRDEGLKEAEVMKVLDETICAFPELRSRTMDIFLSHSDLLRQILSFCRIKPEQQSEVIKVLSMLNVRNTTWEQIHDRLRAKDINIMETSLSILARFNFHDTPEAATEKLTSIFEGYLHSSSVNQLLARLEATITYLARFKISANIYISPLSNNSEPLYRGFLMFQCVDRLSKELVAVGGRYDNLIRKFQPVEAGELNKFTVRAVGFRLATEAIIPLISAGVYKAGARGSKTAARDSPTPHIYRRCDVLVTSFDHSLLKTECLDIIHDLWANAISAELTDDLGSMEELVLAYKNEPHCLIVVLRRNPNAVGERTIKVRSISRRDEVEVHASELVQYLKNGIDEKQDRPVPKLRKLTSVGDTTSSPAKSKADVVVMTPGTSNKKFNRQMAIDAALIGRRELTESILNTAPVVAVDTTDEVLHRIRNTRVSNPESWRAAIRAAPLHDAQYLTELQRQLTSWAEGGEEGAFVFNHRTRGCIFYDLGKTL